jgi:hypothetical protein
VEAVFATEAEAMTVSEQSPSVSSSMLIGCDSVAKKLHTAGDAEDFAFQIAIGCENWLQEYSVAASFRSLFRPKSTAAESRII